MAYVEFFSNNITKLFNIIIYFLSMYCICLSFFGIINTGKRKIVKNYRKFAIIVAAHNEETVIQEIINSLKALKYDKKLYDIYVIADNCEDKTAYLARKSGAMVYERFDMDGQGKGYALEWIFAKLFKLNKNYDAFVIFDADNLVSKNFLTEMNMKMEQGFSVVQGYIDCKNPEDNWVTGCNAITNWTTNRMYQLSRSNLGLSNQLCGTGFAVDTSILKKFGWGATCLTEDLEFTCKLVLNGYKVGWAHNAKVYDEKPLTLKQSWNQRKRWMQGFADVYSRYFFKLMKRAVTKFDIKALDCALYTIQPITLILFCVSMLISFVGYVGKTYSVLTNIDSYIYSLNANMISVTFILAIILQLIYTPFFLILDKKLNFKIFTYYIIFPFYTITWLPISIQGILNKKDKKWNHTSHTRSIDIEDLKKVN